MRNLAILLFFATYFAFAQYEGPRTAAQIGTVYREVPISGTQYVNEMYQKGEAIMNGKSTGEILMRYDAYHEVVEFLENGKPRKLLRRENITAIIDDVRYEVVEFKEKGKSRLGYLSPLNEGETVLYYRPKKQFIQAENPENGYDEYQPATFKDISTYYIKIGDEPATEVRLSKGSILKKLSDQKPVLKKYISEHHLTFKSMEDVTKLLAYYNTIKKTSGSMHHAEMGTTVGK